MTRRLVIALLASACTKGAAEEDRRSTSLPSPRERVNALCALSLCPSAPLDAAFHVYPIEQGVVVHAAVKVEPGDVSSWATGCDLALGEVHPAWAGEVLGPTGWKLKSIPDPWLCGSEKRLIHVKEGVVLRALLLPRP